MKSLVVSSPVISFLYETKWAILKNRSITTQMMSNLDEGSKLVMKSMKMAMDVMKSMKALEENHYNFALETWNLTKSISHGFVETNTVFF